jgi:hypothetical protein
MRSSTDEVRRLLGGRPRVAQRARLGRSCLGAQRTRFGEASHGKPGFGKAGRVAGGPVNRTARQMFAPCPLGARWAGRTRGFTVTGGAPKMHADLRRAGQVYLLHSFPS